MYLQKVFLSARQTIESFHLIFLRALIAKGEDKGLFALKGGCNLRFYFESVRYSEDIDLDVEVIAKATLTNKVDRLLSSPLVTTPLKAIGTSISEVSKPKQTETTQRWKLGLSATGSGGQVRTKIEFSRRDAIKGTSFEAIGRQVLLPYAITPFLANHYTRDVAIAQKIIALADRPETQARDVFDLNLLLAGAAGQTKPDTEAKRRVESAIERAMSISFDEYEAQVVAFLEPEQAVLYRDRESWDLMQTGVVEALEAMR